MITQNSSNGTMPTATTPRTRLPCSQPSLDKIQLAGGMVFIAGRIGEGDSLTQIAKTIGICRSELSGFLCNSNDALYPAAMHQSAEILYDRAEEALRAADPTSMPSVQQAKAIADLYTRRAGVRNFRYAVRGMTLDIAPAAPAAMPSFTLVLTSAPSSGLTIEGEPSDIDLHDNDRI